MLTKPDFYKDFKNIKKPLKHKKKGTITHEQHVQNQKTCYKLSEPMKSMIEKKGKLNKNTQHKRKVEKGII